MHEHMFSNIIPKIFLLKTHLVDRKISFIVFDNSNVILDTSINEDLIPAYLPKVQRIKSYSNASLQFYKWNMLQK